MPAAELVDRFRTELSRSWPDFGDNGARLGVAASGGSDSLGLLLLAHEALPGRIEAATVDHGLRPESQREAAFVAKICQALGVPHASLGIEVAKGNLQAEARKARYAALGDWVDQRGLAALATAHQLDDQAETLLMRLNRGSGLGGLAGIRARTAIPVHGGLLLRPVLTWRRSELADVVADAGIEPVHDSSNQDRRFDRVRVREGLRVADWIDPSGLAKSAHLLAEANQAIEELLDREWNDAVEPQAHGFCYFPSRTTAGGSPFHRSGMIELIYRKLGKTLQRSDAARIATELEAGRSVNVAGIAAKPAERGTKWVFGPENPRRPG